MSSQSIARIVRAPRLPVNGWSVVLFAAMVLVLALCGIAIVARPVLAVAPLVLGFFVAVACDWRRAVRVLCFFLPFAGLPVFLLSQRYGPIFKDLLIVLPLYIAFVYEVTSKPADTRRIDPIALLMLLFVGLALVYLLLTPSPAIGAIALKVWLWYFPLYFVGRRYVTSLEDIIRLLRPVALLALIPAAIAFAEVFYFVKTGGFGPLLRLYGPVAPNIVRQVGFYVQVPRIESTFTSPESYYNFGLVATASALVLWRFKRSGWYGALAFILAGATIASGERRAYVTVPMLVVVGALIMRPNASLRIRLALAGALAVFVLGSLGVPLSGVSGQLAPGAAISATASRNEFTTALHHDLFGKGTGSGTNAAIEYGGLPNKQIAESWYTKAFSEFGLLGFFVAAALIATIVVQSFVGVRRLPSFEREVAAPLVALLFVTSFTLAKASELDWDPMDAYFWLLAGCLMGLVRSVDAAERKL